MDGRRVDGSSQQSRGLGGNERRSLGLWSWLLGRRGSGNKESKEPSAVGADNDDVNKRSRGLRGGKEYEDEIVSPEKKHCGSRRQR